MGVGPKARRVSAPVKKRRAPVAPRNPPGDPPRLWQETVDGHGIFYFHGSVVRNGERSYLVRRDPTETEHGRAVCLLSEQGAVLIWYTNYPLAVCAAVCRAGEAAVVHSVMSA